MDYGENMISSEERERESEERNFISFHYSLNVQYFPLDIKCSHETLYSLLSSDHLFAGNSRGKDWETCNLGVHSSDRSPEYKYTELTL